MSEMGFKLEALFGWGIVIYAVMFLVWSGFVTYGFVEGLVPRAAGLLVLLTITIIAGRSLHAISWRDILPYSLTWGVMMVMFDAIMSVPYTGWGMFADWTLWFGYAAVVLGPLFALYPRFERFSRGTPRL